LKIKREPLPPNHRVDNRNCTSWTWCAVAELYFRRMGNWKIGKLQIT